MTDESTPQDDANKTTAIIPSPHETYERFGLPPIRRVLTGAALGYGGGLFLGLPQGGRTAALRFRAENAHRLPTNQRGWYLYHQYKDADIIKEGFKEGNRFGLRLLPMTLVFFGVEETMDTLRLKEVGDDSRKDFLSSTIAGLTVAGGFSILNHLPIVQAAQTAKMGLVCGLTFGLAQDALQLFRGRRLAYVDLIGKILGFKRPINGQLPEET